MANLRFTTLMVLALTTVVAIVACAVATALRPEGNELSLEIRKFPYKHGPGHTMQAERSDELEARFDALFRKLGNRIARAVGGGATVSDISFESTNGSDALLFRVSWPGSADAERRSEMVKLVRMKESVFRGEVSAPEGVKTLSIDLNSNAVGDNSP